MSKPLPRDEQKRKRPVVAENATAAAVPESAVRGELVLYSAEDGQAKFFLRADGGTVWLTQAEIASLFQTTPQNITLHVKAIYAEGELDAGPTCKSSLQVQTEGARKVRRTVKAYNLDLILAVGYRVRSPRGTQFRRWASTHLKEYLIKGFVLDDARLKDPAGWDYSRSPDDAAALRPRECQQSCTYHRKHRQTPRPPRRAGDGGRMKPTRATSGSLSLPYSLVSASGNKTATPLLMQAQPWRFFFLSAAGISTKGISRAPILFLIVDNVGF